MTVSSVLLIGFLTLAAVWAALSAVILLDRARYQRRTRLLRDLAARLEGPGSPRLPLDERVDRVASVLRPASRGVVLRLVADLATPEWALDLLAAHFVKTWGPRRLVEDAVHHGGERQKRRRIAALRILSYGRYPHVVDLLERSLADEDADVVGTSVSLLGMRSDARSAQLLVSALGHSSYPPSRVATYLDQFPVPVLTYLRPLLHDPKPVVRFWAATLLGRYAGTRGLDTDLAALVNDPEPSVRKAAVESAGKIGGPAAAAMALELLGDPVWYVQAHAARALGDLGRVDLATRIAPLLADRQWWVRVAAKEALEAMGPEIWSDLVPFLDHPDPFARNGAAEVFQNIGILDSLVVMEAATDGPGEVKIEMLRKIASAGGVRMTDALLERAGPQMRPRIRRLLEMLGLERAGSH